MIIPHWSYLIAHTTKAGPTSLLTSRCSYLMAHTSLVIAHWSYLIGHTSVLIPHCSSLLIHHGLLLVAHASLLIPHSSYLIALTSLLIPHCSYLTAHAVLLIPLWWHLIAHTSLLIPQLSIIPHCLYLVAHSSLLRGILCLPEMLAKARRGWQQIRHTGANLLCPLAGNSRRAEAQIWTQILAACMSIGHAELSRFLGPKLGP